MDIKIKRLLKDLHNSDDDLRTLSAMTLMKLDFPEQETRNEVVSNLVKATQDENVSVRFFARKALDKISMSEKLMITSVEGANVPIKDRLASPNFRTRLSAVMDIKNKAEKDEKGIKEEYKAELQKMLETEDHPFVIAGLISCLKYFLEKEEASLLSRFLTDSDNRVRSNTIEAIEYLKAEDAIPSLFSALSDKDNRIRAVAAKALQSFGEEKVFAELKKMLESPEEWMKGSAIYALSHIQAGEAIKMLMEAARKSTSPDTKTKAVIALANYCDSTAYSFLKGMSLNGDDASKEAAVRALKLMEEKHGSEPPTTTIVTEDFSADDKNENLEKQAEAPKEEDLATTVTRFFRRGKEEAIGLSNKTAINFALNDLKKEIDEHVREVGRSVYDLYQGGELEWQDLVSIGNEILRMNYFIQKYSEQSEKKAAPESSEGFFAQLKSFFSPKTQEQKKSSNLIETYTKRRDDLFLRMGQLALRKYEDKEDDFKPKSLEPQYLTYQKLATRLEKEQKRLEESGTEEQR